MSWWRFDGSAVLGRGEVKAFLQRIFAVGLLAVQLPVPVLEHAIEAAWTRPELLKNKELDAAVVVRVAPFAATAAIIAAAAHRPCCC